MQKKIAEHETHDPPPGFCIQTLSVFSCPYLPSTPGLEVSIEKVSSDRFSYDLHQGLRRTFTSRGSPEYTHGVRRLTMLVHRFNAQPMTIQRLHCCLSSPHRICLAVSMAVDPSRRSVPCLAPGNRFVREALLLSCQDSSRGESVRFTPLLIKRGQVAPLYSQKPRKIFLLL